jgi:hypothetical protein
LAFSDNVRTILSARRCSFCSADELTIWNERQNQEIMLHLSKEGSLRLFQRELWTPQYRWLRPQIPPLPMVLLRLQAEQWNWILHGRLEPITRRQHYWSYRKV